MSLSCGCEYDSDAEWHWIDNLDFSVKRRLMSMRKRCQSCRRIIKFGDVCVAINRFREPRDDIELKIHGEGGDIYLPTQYLCEECGGLFFSLQDLGFCVNPTNNMHALLNEYHEMKATK